MRNPVEMLTDTLLMGPGPSSVHPSTLRAMAAPVLGHLDPRFLGIMDETIDALRAVFQTSNRVTLPVSGTGSAGMETAEELGAAFGLDVTDQAFWTASLDVIRTRIADYERLAAGVG